MSDTQRDREERQHVIEVLKSWDGYFIGYTSDEVQEALRYAIASIETDLRYDLLYEETNGQADKPTTKNNLGVDLISREQAKTAIRDKFKDLPSRVEINTILNELPSVTPIRPKGHWIEHEKSISTAFKHLRECSCCKCYFDWMMPRNSYCPNCGSDNREVE